MYALLVTLACTSGSDSSPKGNTGDSGSDSATDSTPQPVWDAYAVQSSSTLMGVYASGDGVYVAGTDGYAWVGGNDGWAYLTPDVDGYDFNSLWGQGVDDTLVLAAPAGTGRVARYSAGTWVTDNLDDVGDFLGITGTGPNNILVVGWGRALTFDGTSWTYEALPENDNVNDVYGDSTTAFAVGEGGTIVYRDSGVWSEVTPVSTAALKAVSGSSMSDVWAVGEEGTALHWDGSSWTDASTGSGATLWGVFVPGDGNAFVVGDNGTAMSWDGTSWTDMPTGVDNNLYAIHGISSSNMWATGNRGMALQYKAN